MIYHILVYVTTFLLISIVPWQSTGPVWPCRDKKTPPPDVEEEEELMMEAWQGRKWSSPPPHFSFDYKTVAH